MGFTSVPGITTLAFPGIAAAIFKAKATFDLHVKIKPLEFAPLRGLHFVTQRAMVKHYISVWFDIGLSEYPGPPALLIALRPNTGYCRVSSSLPFKFNNLRV